MKKLLIILTGLAFFYNSASALLPGDETTVYIVNTEESRIYWTGKKVTREHTGYVLINEGSITMEEEKPVSSNITADMTSIVCTDIEKETSNAKLVNHLKSVDFFAVEEFPKAYFEAISFEPIATTEADQENYTVTGNLTIKGITHQISFPAWVYFEDDGLNVQGAAIIDRAKWEVKHGSGSFFEGLGDNLIYDDVELRFTLVAETIDLN